MSALTQEFAELAVEMLGEDGVPVSILPALNAGIMTASGDRTGTPPERSCVGIIFPTSGTIQVDGRDRARERVITTPVDPWPSPGERISINGRSLVIGDDGVKTYAPDGLPIIHDIMVAS